MSGGIRIPSPDWLPPNMREQARAQLGIASKPTKRTKYGNRKTVVDGITFDSKRESRRYELLKERKRAGEIKGFALQARFVLAGGVVYVCDFVVFNNDGTYVVEDSKSEGTRTKVFRIKQRQMKSEHGIEISLV